MIDRMDVRLPPCRFQGRAHVAKTRVCMRAMATKKITTTTTT
jgi:hypothetical protein